MTIGIGGSAIQDEFNETGLDLYGTTENLIWAEEAKGSKGE